MRERNLIGLIAAGLMVGGCQDIPPVPTPPEPTLEITPTEVPEGFWERQAEIEASYRTETRELTPTQFLILENLRIIIVIVTATPEKTEEN